MPKDLHPLTKDLHAVTPMVDATSLPNATERAEVATLPDATEMVQATLLPDTMGGADGTPSTDADSEDADDSAFVADVMEEGRMLRMMASEFVSAKSQPLSVPAPPQNATGSLILLLTLLGSSAGQDLKASSGAPARTSRHDRSDQLAPQHDQPVAHRVARQSPAIVPTEILDAATLQIISRRWTDRDFLLDRLDHYEHQVQQQFLNAQEAPDADQDVLFRLLQLCSKIEVAKGTVYQSTNHSENAEAFNMVFPGAIEPRDVRIQKVLDDDYTPDDLTLLFDEAYPASTHAGTLLKSCLSTLFQQHGETRLTPDSVVELETFDFSETTSGLHSNGKQRDTLLRIALGKYYADLWNGHLEIKGLPPTLATLFRKPRYFGGYTFPVTQLLHDEANTALGKLRHPDAAQARQLLWRGKIFSALADFFTANPQHHALKDKLQHDAGLYTLGFNFGAGDAVLNNIIALRKSEHEFIVLNVITTENCTVSTHEGSGRAVQEKLARLVPAAISLKRALFIQKRSDMEFMFWDQKPYYKRWHRLSSYKNPGEVFFHQEEISIDAAAATLAKLEIETLESDLDFLTVIESEVQKRALIDGIDMAFTRMSLVTSAPLMGWSPAILGLSMAIAPAATRYALDEANSKDLIDRGEAYDRFCTSMYELVVYGAASSAGLYAMLATRRFVKHNGPKRLLDPAMPNKRGSEVAPAEFAANLGSNAVAQTGFRAGDAGPGAVDPERFYRYPRSDAFTTLVGENKAAFYRLYQEHGQVVHYRTIAGTDYVHLTTFTGSSYDPSRTLLLTAHGGYVPTDLGRPAVKIPFGVETDFFVPHGAQLVDPGLYYIMNSVTDHRTYAVFTANAFKNTVLKRRPVFQTQEQNKAWKLGVDYDPYSPRALFGGQRGLVNYRHLHYEHDTPFKAASSLLANRKSREVENVDILLVNGDVTAKWQTHPLRNSVQSVLDLVKGGDIINPGPHGTPYRVVKFLHCRNDFTELPSLLSAYNMRLGDVAPLAQYSRAFEAGELWAIVETTRTLQTHPQPAKGQWSQTNRLLAVRFLYRSDEIATLSELLGTHNVDIYKIALPDALDDASMVSGIFDITVDFPSPSLTHVERGSGQSTVARDVLGGVPSHVPGDVPNDVAPPATSDVPSNVTITRRLLGLKLAEGHTSAATEAPVHRDSPSPAQPLTPA